MSAFNLYVYLCILCSGVCESGCNHAVCMARIDEIAINFSSRGFYTLKLTKQPN